MQQTLRIILTPEPEGGFTVTVPSLPGCVTWGETVEEAKNMGREAIDIYIEDMQANGEEVPDDGDSLGSWVIIGKETCYRPHPCSPLSSRLIFTHT